MMETPTIQAPQTSSFNMLKAMVVIGVLCALLIVLTFEGTLPRIQQLRAEALEKAVFKVLPGTVSIQAFHYGEEQGFVEINAKDQSPDLVYAGYDQQGTLIGMAVEASGQGYADVLGILYGYSPENETIVGFHVLESKETPGLGDKIEKDPEFLSNFNGLDVSLKDNYKELKNMIVPVKHGTKTQPWEVDGITGATISSRAIGNIMGASTRYWVPLLYSHQQDFKLTED